jgi:hypothetical protein
MNLETMLILAEPVVDEGWPEVRSIGSPASPLDAEPSLA